MYENLVQVNVSIKNKGRNLFPKSMRAISEKDTPSHLFTA